MIEFIILFMLMFAMPLAAISTAAFVSIETFEDSSFRVSIAGLKITGCMPGGICSEGGGK